MKELGIKGTIRVSIAFYNTKEDIDIFIKALRKAISILGNNMSEIENRIEQFKDDLDFFDEELEKYEYIVDLGKK